MELDKKTLFQKLLAQLNWEPTAEQNKYFETTEITKVEIHRLSKRWEFSLRTQKVWPFALFQVFSQKLHTGFSEIAQTDLKIQATEQVLDSKRIAEYWEWVVKNCGVHSPFVQELKNGMVPYVEQKRVLLLAENEIIKHFLVNQALGPIEETYQRVGFPQFAIHTLIDESKSQQKIAEFKQEKAKNDAKLAQKAVQAIQQQNQKKENSPVKIEGPVTLGRKIDAKEQPRQMNDITEEERSVIVQGYIFDKEVRSLRSSRKLLIIKVTDYSSSLVVKKFSRNEEDEACFDAIQEGQWVKIRGNVQEDSFLRDLVLNAFDINQIKHEQRKDSAPADQKRAELHLHTNMSMMDATNSITAYVEQAAAWGQKAIAVTDHATLQAFPEAHTAGQKNNVKILYGVEANVVDDGTPIAYNEQHVSLKDAVYVVFDTETTGLSARFDKVIELAAVKMQHGAVLDRFDEFIDPGHPLSRTTTELTSITDAMVRGSKSEKEVFELFQEFCQDSIIVGHNATFDVDFMNTGYQRQGLPLIANPWIDTLPFARFLYPQLKGFRLNRLAKMLNVELEHHHRAIYDAEATGYIYFAMLKEAQAKYQIEFLDQLNAHVGEHGAYKHEHPFHATIIAATQAGLKNLFKLASISMVKYFYRVPRIPRSVLVKYREGLIIGSACASGEVFTAMMQKGFAEAKEKARFYDYLEVQPKPLYAPLMEQELVKNEKDLEEIIKNMVELGEQLQLPVAATGDVHFLNKEDAVYRKILIHSQGGANPLNRLKQLPDAHFRTTDEMLAEFSFLGKQAAQKVVITGPDEIVNMTAEISPVKDKLYTPKMPGAEDEIRNLALNQAHKLYGDPLPKIVQARLDKELKSVIGNGFSVIYLISQKLVYKSNKDGYLVGSRGSVGSSLAATMTGITEVNPLPPHYRCPKCQWSHFYEKGEYGSGFDLPDKNCPECATPLIKDGQDIPFETFLGFYGNKVPDIDLNFSGDYQPVAHNYTKVLFGEGNVFRAGTIGTVADKTAYGYVKAYERDTEQTFRNAEVDRLAKGATGVKRTTGQHPAGILVVPDYMDIYDFTPIQYPADDLNATWKTTHFDFHSIHDNILKLDILGHDDPTMIRMLQDLSGVNPKSIPTDDPGVMQLFSGTEILKVTPEQIGSNTGTLGIPEFGTRFVRGMLEETKPKTFAELLKISGLSHGTDVWLGNAEELIKNGTVTMPEVIGCRDDIMMDLIHMGVEADRAFKIMEHVRKGRGIPDDWQAEMREAKVPEWYIGACLKIKYMFPKAHAAAYVLMALRIAYFKVYFPLLYYSAYFSVRADDFDLLAMSRGKQAVKDAMKEITDKGMDASTKEKNLLTVLELANEMQERGFSFKMVDLQHSAVSDWLIKDNSLLAPFDAMPGLGTNVAKQIVAAREEKPFLSKEDLAKRGKVSKTLIDYMTENHVLDELPDENQLSLFDSMF
ncbi:PolC-type DNA polymerase III [Liquorilactobacillus satsumensis]|uniref:DNA polymerase III PolC-type n=1 Tax=Liquorilactobacillus satsumensis DSM 16230 = JCM 12392 TaxID=1423801 RepID=A0A0R1V8V2_9LACO|nr:PolC-type DNA polymerase III [Liquorilactobacillus satsumensis]KRL99413.1 DNA polymerase III PolC [Liquorilactobacillus satsumensis DSM 16230 = JCM 12392]